MIGATSLASIQRSDASTLCEWPGCTEHRDSRTMCRKHQLRIERGSEVGCETPWERLVAAALRLADAETDREFNAASEGLKRAAETFRRQRKHPHKGRAA